MEGISYALASVGGKEISSTLTETTSVVLMGEDGTPADRQNVTVSTETVEVTVPVRQVVSIPLTVDRSGEKLTLPLTFDEDTPERQAAQQKQLEQQEQQQKQQQQNNSGSYYWPFGGFSPWFY